MNNFRQLIRSGFLALSLLVFSTSAGASEWQRGDVFVAIGNGQYQVYRQTGIGELGPIYTLIETLTDGSGAVSGENGSGGNGYSTGCGFDSTGHLYTTNFTNGNVYKFSIPDPHTVSQPPIGASPGALASESIVFDGQGNFFVGHAEGTRVVDQFSPAGNLITSFTVGTEDRGSDWIELSADGNTLYYTSEGTLVKTFNLSSGTQGADIVTLPSPAFAARFLPPSFGAFAGDLLVADSGTVERITFSDGAFIDKSYTIEGETALFALSPDINGTSFWVGDFLSGNFYRINVASGQIEVGPITIPNTGSTAGLGGICVNGAAGAAEPQPVVQTVSLDPTHNSGTVNNDNNSNSWTITLNGLTTSATATITFTEVPPSAGVSDSGRPCEPASADGTKCTVHQVSVDTTNYSSINFYHHWAFKPPTPINPRMIKNGAEDITTAVYLDPGTAGRTKSPSTYTDNEAPLPTGSSCGFAYPSNNATWEAEFPLPILFRAVSAGGNCRKGPYLTTLSPLVSLGRVVSGTVVPIKLKSTSFKLSTLDKKTWYYFLATRNLQPGTYVVTVFDQSNRIPAFSEQINIVPEN